MAFHTSVRPNLAIVTPSFSFTLQLSYREPLSFTLTHSASPQTVMHLENKWKSKSVSCAAFAYFRLFFFFLIFFRQILYVHKEQTHLKILFSPGQCGTPPQEVFKTGNDFKPCCKNGIDISPLLVINQDSYHQATARLTCDGGSFCHYLAIKISYENLR